MKGTLNQVQSETCRVDDIPEAQDQPFRGARAGREAAVECRPQGRWANRPVDQPQYASQSRGKTFQLCKHLGSHSRGQICTLNRSRGVQAGAGFSSSCHLFQGA